MAFVFPNSVFRCFFASLCLSLSVSVSACVLVYLDLSLPISPRLFVSPSLPLRLPPTRRNNNLTFLRPYYQTEEGEENPFICSSRRDNGMQKCSHIPSRRELRVECTLGWEAYGQPQAEGVAGAGRNACINWNQYYNVCRSGGSNPHNGAINFDNIGYAWIAIFQVGPGSAAEGLGLSFPIKGVHRAWGGPGGSVHLPYQPHGGPRGDAGEEAPATLPGPSVCAAACPPR